MLSIYGNHENIEVLKSARNRRERHPVLMRDGRVYEINGLKLAGINGVISDRKHRSREGVPFKRPEEYLSIAYSLKGKDIDILLIHEAPYIPDLFPSIKESISSITTLEVIKIVEPKLVIGGHVHDECMEPYRVTSKTIYTCLDSSQLSRRYLVMSRENGVLRVEQWRDRDMEMDLITLSIDAYSERA